MRMGINSPCLPLARPKPRVPLGVVQDAGTAAYNGAQTTDGGRGGEGRGQVRGGDAPPQRETPSVGSMACGPPAAVAAAGPCEQ